MTLTDLSPPPSGPVALDTAKTFLRVDHDADDALITQMIDTAARQIEARIGASLIKRPQRLIKRACGAGVYLNRSPIDSIESVQINGVSVSFAANLRARPVRLRFGGAGEVQVDFTAGFGITPEDIPTPLRQGVLLLLAHLYEYRAGDAPPLGFPMMVDALIQPYSGVRL